MIIDDEYLACAYFEGDRRFQEPGAVRLSLRTLASLSIPSGQIVACDPLVFPDALPLDVALPVGEFPVIVSVVHVGDDQRIGFARVQFRDEVPVSWRHVSQPGQDINALAFDEYFGYPVDAGTGCFMDVAAAKQLLRRMDAEEDYFETIIEEMEKTYVDTWSWANVSPTDELNIICFSSGYGDGSYPSFVGYTEKDELVCLLTDFMVVSGTSPRP